eukprot:TRINITY_DN15606_c2_g1_i1.p1 TRINITY_DN15606_c2_g1~~TRINITY_DN15606_c2_g1_i1.p1  ORF type:complete len:1412 (+),score=240.46 TRINITY_DN15606_c2_g1_i1:108-4238(+)
MWPMRWRPLQPGKQRCRSTLLLLAAALPPAAGAAPGLQECSVGSFVVDGVTRDSPCPTHTRGVTKITEGQFLYACERRGAYVCSGDGGGGEVSKCTAADGDFMLGCAERTLAVSAGVAAAREAVYAICGGTQEKLTRCDWNTGKAMASSCVELPVNDLCGAASATGIEVFPLDAQGNATLLITCSSDIANTTGAGLLACKLDSPDGQKVDRCIHPGVNPCLAVTNASGSALTPSSDNQGVSRDSGGGVTVACPAADIAVYCDGYRPFASGSCSWRRAQGASPCGALGYPSALTGLAEVNAESGRAGLSCYSGGWRLCGGTGSPTASPTVRPADAPQFGVCSSSRYSVRGKQQSGPCPNGGPTYGCEQVGELLLCACGDTVYACDGDGSLSRASCAEVNGNATLGCAIASGTSASVRDVAAGAGGLSVYAACNNAFAKCAWNGTTRTAASCRLIGECKPDLYEVGIALAPGAPPRLAVSCALVGASPLVNPAATVYSCGLDDVSTSNCTASTMQPCASNTWYRHRALSFNSQGGLTVGCDDQPGAEYCNWTAVGGAERCVAVAGASPCPSRTYGVAEMDSGYYSVSCAAGGVSSCRPTQPPSAPPSAAPTGPSGCSGSTFTPTWAAASSQQSTAGGDCAGANCVDGCLAPSCPSCCTLSEPSPWLRVEFRDAVSVDVGCVKITAPAPYRARLRVWVGNTQGSPTSNEACYDAGSEQVNPTTAFLPLDKTCSGQFVFVQFDTGGASAKLNFTEVEVATVGPTSSPSTDPTVGPSAAPQTQPPSVSPTAPPSQEPTRDPSSGSPTVAPSPNPTISPRYPKSPSNSPRTRAPTGPLPTGFPTSAPALSPPSSRPSPAPSVSPYHIGLPSKSPVTPPPSWVPSTAPPSLTPTSDPSISPRQKYEPSRSPLTSRPVWTAGPTRLDPTVGPTAGPSVSPWYVGNPSNSPRLSPPTLAPTATAPTAAPLRMPSISPRRPYEPSVSPVTNAPSRGPSSQPPSGGPTRRPLSPTFSPHFRGNPSSSPVPPSDAPVRRPTAGPSQMPTIAPYTPGAPSAGPQSTAPSAGPTLGPAVAPSAAPYTPGSPSAAPAPPTAGPSAAPSVAPYTAGSPSAAPLLAPSWGPSAAPYTNGTPSRAPLTTPPVPAPSAVPSNSSAPPTVAPHSAGSPSAAPVSPTRSPTQEGSPTASPTDAPSGPPSASPAAADSESSTMPIIIVSIVAFLALLAAVLFFGRRRKAQGAAAAKARADQEKQRAEATAAEKASFTALAEVPVENNDNKVPANWAAPEAAASPVTSPAAPVAQSPMLSPPPHSARGPAPGPGDPSGFHPNPMLSVGLPPGWKAGTDVARQRTYYYNKQTGQRQWRHPSSDDGPPRRAGRGVAPLERS